MTSRKYLTQRAIQQFLDTNEEFSPRDIQSFVEFWEETTGSDFKDFRSRVSKRLQLAKHTPFFINYQLGTKEFDSLTDAVNYACSMCINYSDFLEFHRNSYRFHSVAELEKIREYILDNEGYREEIEELSKPKNWFKSLFSNNSEHISELECLIRDNEAAIGILKEENRPVIQELMALETPLLQRRQQLRGAFLKKDEAPVVKIDDDFPFGTPEELAEEKRLTAIAIEQLKIEAIKDRLRACN